MISEWMEINNYVLQCCSREKTKTCVKKNDVWFNRSINMWLLWQYQTHTVTAAKLLRRRVTERHFVFRICENKNLSNKELNSRSVLPSIHDNI